MAQISESVIMQVDLGPVCIWNKVPFLMLYII